jgi:hypothetical protein
MKTRSKDAKKEPVQYIKAVRGGVKPEDRIAFYRIKDGIDVRDVLDQITKNGKPDGKDGVDYIKVKGDELPEVQKLFSGNENMPKTYYYTSAVKGNGTDKNGKPYNDGKVRSVTVLSDHDNRTNKNYTVKDVFRKAEEADDKKEKAKDKATYYYILTLGANKDKPKEPQITKATGDTDIKDVYNKLKGDLSYKPGKGNENDGVLLIKAKSDKNPKDILNKIKSTGANINKPAPVRSQPKPKSTEPKPATSEQKPKSLEAKPEDTPAIPGVLRAKPGEVYGVVKVKSDKLNKPDKPGKPDDKKAKPTQPESTDKTSDEEDDELIISDNSPNKLKQGILSPEDPINEELVNNLEVMAEPIYTPENYIFVNEFEKEMDKIMNKLGKYDKDPEEEKDDDKVEVSDNYLSHLNNLYSKVIPFVEDLHKEMEKTPDDQMPDLKKEKEDNLDRVLSAADTYCKTDEDPEV